MKKIIFSLNIILTCHCVSLAQVTEFRNYDWEPNPQLHVLSEQEQKEASIILKDKRVTEYIYNNEDALERFSLYHKIIKVNEDKAVEDNNKIYVAVNSSESLLNLKARTISSSGKIVEMFKGNMKQINENGSEYMILAVEGLAKGSELEFFYTVKRSVYYFGTEYFQSATLRKDAECTIISPPNLIFESKSYNGFPELKQDTTKGKKKCITASLAVVPIRYDEKYSAYNDNLMRVEYKLAKNTYKGQARLFTWADAGKRYYEILHPDGDKKDKDIDKIISKLKIKSLPDEEKIRAVENYIKTNLNVRETSEDETFSSMLQNKYASKLGMLRLFTKFYDQLEVKSEPVITCNRFSTKLDPDFDTWNYLDEYLLYFPDYKKYLDPTDYSYRYSLIPYQYTTNNALFIKEVAIGDTKSGVATIKKIPQTPMSLSYDNLNIDIKFSDNKEGINMHLKRSMAGYQAIGVRPYYFYMTEEKRKELVDGILKQGIEDAKLTNTKVVNYDLTTTEADKDFIIESDLYVTSLVEKAGNKLIFKVGETIGPQTEMYQEKPRQSPVESSNPHSYNRVINITIPDGYEVKGLEKLKINIVFESNGNTTGFTSDYTINGNILSITAREFYADIYYPLEKFEDYKKVINAAADFNKISLVFEKK
jgi:hypothetical protein